MKLRIWLILSLCWLPAVGCRTDPAVTILERELRRKEDEIYRLRATIEDLQELAFSCQEQAGATVEGTRSTPTKAAPRRDTAPNGIAPPEIELPGKPSGKSLLPSEPAGAGARTESLPRLIPADNALESAPVGMSLLPSGDSRRVVSIVLDRTLTGGLAAEDGSVGDQGLLVVVEPRDAAGRVVDAPAEISVAVLDPAITDAQGKALRIARWDFTAAEVADLFRRGPTGPAIYLTMVWPERPPQHSSLQLFVRYVTADGRKLLAEAPIEIALPDVSNPPNLSGQHDLAGRLSMPNGRSERLGARRLRWSPERQ